MVDRFVEPHAVERTLAELDLWRGRWRIREPATLVVLSEERSPRWSGVGLDPQGLEGMAGLGSRFEQVIVSASVPEHVDAAGCSVAPPWSYTGPLAAMAAGLEASRNDLALVVPGSLATLDGELVERLLWATEGCDAAVLLAGGQAEPALIACRRGLVPLARAALSQGQRWIGAFLAKCRTKAVDKAFHEPGHRLQEGRAPMDSTDGGAGAQEGGGGL
jgi:molybdopterin-guanine dinucleotide biosynthesis protein A